MLDIELKQCESTNIHQLVLAGEFDLLEAERVEMTLCEALIEDITGLIVDASKIVYLDSSAVGLLITYHMKLQEMGVRMVIVLDPDSYLPKKLANLGVFNSNGIELFEDYAEAKSALLKSVL